MKTNPSGGKTAKAKFRRPRKTTAKPSQAINTQTHPDAAGIDVGAEEFVVAVPIGRCDEPVRTYTTFTSGVHALRDWLLECGITTAAMESTGNYWITLYDALTEAGIDVYPSQRPPRQRRARQKDRRLRCPVAPATPRRWTPTQILPSCA